MTDKQTSKTPEVDAEIKDIAAYMLAGLKQRLEALRRANGRRS